MVQATEQTSAGERTLVALWSVIRRLKALSAAEGADPAAMAIVHLVNEHGPLRLTALADVACLDASTASRHVRNLEAAGYVERRPDPADGRATLIAVGERGRELMRRGMEARARRFDEALAGWDEADRDALPRLLARFAEDLG